MILNTLPDSEVFYSQYWNKQPFVVRSAIDKTVFSNLIDAESLAALSMEEDVKSRIVITQDGGSKWLCEHGPFEEGRFASLGDNNWSLLVQNVEQYHPSTASLLQSFNFSLRWLMDDIMVSYSADGGSVGPHIDSYHVFLVQGIGKRSWTIGQEPLQNEECIEGLDLQVLSDGVVGETVTVTMGDVIYIPPHFAHEGKTIEEALTFSVGFLGPKMSDILIEYGHFIEQNEAIDCRYSGIDLGPDSKNFFISQSQQFSLQSSLKNALDTDSFAKFLSSYFSRPTYDLPENIVGRKNEKTEQEILDILDSGSALYKPEHIKLTITGDEQDAMYIGAYGSVISIRDKELKVVFEKLSRSEKITSTEIKSVKIQDDLIEIVTHLYNQGVLFFENEDLMDY